MLITVLPYFKLPLDGPRYVSAPDGPRKLDYRRDVLSEMVWSIRHDQTGLENVEFVVTMNHYFDNVPPALPAALLAEAGADGRVFDRTVADASHRYAMMALRIRW